MTSAKELHVAPISQKNAAALVRKIHYSGKTTQNSQLHLGVFLNKKLEGVMQFGPSIDKRRMLGLVKGTKWNEFIELNRMAFSEQLPKNSESRALSVAIKIMRKTYPHIKWIVSFADGTQCGDGTIYRASGFLLTAIKPNSTMLRMPDGSVVADKTLNDHPVKNTKYWKTKGAVPLPGFQLRYLYFLHKKEIENLTVPIVPFYKIDEVGAAMYRGEKREKQAMASFPEAQRQGGTDLHAPKLKSLHG